MITRQLRQKNDCVQEQGGGGIKVVTETGSIADNAYTHPEEVSCVCVCTSVVDMFRFDSLLHVCSTRKVPFSKM